MHSPFAHLIHTNYAPNASESSHIIEFIAKPAAELERLDIEITRAQLALELLTGERKAVQDMIDSHWALLSPIRQIPNEILQRIFGFCLHAKRNPVMHESEAPLLLRRICRHWKNVSEDSPRLWSGMHIVTNNGRRLGQTAAVAQENIDRMETWLGWSKSVPLDISLFNPCDNFTSTVKSHTPDFLQAIQHFSNRLRSIALSMPQIEIADAASKFIGGGDVVPLLESFSYSDLRTDDAHSSELTHAFMFLNGAPNLHRFSISCVGIFPPLQLPWQQLTEISIISHQCRRELGGEMPWLEMLEACTSLEVCSLTYRHGPSAPITSHRQITLPHLGRLCICSPWVNPIRHPSHPPRSLLDSLTLPNLTELESSSHLGVAVAFFILGLLERSSCPLEKLVLKETDGTLNVDYLRQCFQLIPDLSELQITLPCSPFNYNTLHLGTTVEVLCLLTPSSTITADTTHILPYLRQLSIGKFCWNDHPDIHHRLLWLLRARAKTTPMLTAMEECRLEFSDTPRASFSAEIEEAAGGFMKLSVEVAASALSATHARLVTPWTGLGE